MKPKYKQMIVIICICFLILLAYFIKCKYMSVNSHLILTQSQSDYSFKFNHFTVKDLIIKINKFKSYKDVYNKDRQIIVENGHELKLEITNTNYFTVHDFCGDILIFDRNKKISTIPYCEQVNLPYKATMTVNKKVINNNEKPKYTIKFNLSSVNFSH